MERDNVTPWKRICLNGALNEDGGEEVQTDVCWICVTSLLLCQQQNEWMCFIFGLIKVKPRRDRSVDSRETSL